LNGFQRCTESGRKPDREGSSGHPSCLAICTAVRRSTSAYYHDVEPSLKKKIPVIWVNRTKQQLEPGQKKPDVEVSNLKEAAKLLGIG
jgi:hypothetical protein